ncbi:MAG: YceI family protein [Rhodospirillales bacterium]
MRPSFLPLLTALVLSAGPAFAAQATPWVVEPEKSAISFSGEHAGTSFEGVFEEWTADIEFDPQAPEEAVVEVVIETASAKTGNALYDGTLIGADWFDVEGHPQARFEAQGATPDGEGNFILAGTLTLRGHSVPVSVAFTADQNQATADSTVVLERMDFKMGAESDPAGTWVSLEIPVKVILVAKPEDG